MRLALVALALAGAAALPAAATPLAPSHEFAAEPSASLDPAVEAYIASLLPEHPPSPPLHPLPALKKKRARATELPALARELTAMLWERFFPAVERWCDRALDARDSESASSPS